MSWISSARAMAAMAAMAAPALGCGGATGATASGVAGLPADFTGPGSYTVPAVPTVQFPISSVHIEQAGGTVSLYYELPAELVGQKTRVEVTGASDGTGAIQLSGEAGTSTCTVSRALLRCDEDLSGVHVAAPPASSPLSGSDPERAAAQAFLSDPIGVLSVALPP